jgi:mRNA interferase MazF
VSFDQWAVVVVPFPFTDRNTTKRRPALVLSDRGEFGRQAGHSVMVMITTASHSRWPLDVVLADRETAGLPAPSLVRMKLFTLDDRLVQRQLGTLSLDDRAAVKAALDRLLG